MAAEQPRSKKRTRVDWAKARAFYVALPRTERTFASVAREFSVSTVSVRKHAHEEGWIESADNLDRELADRELAQAVRTREQRNQMFLRVTDLALGRALDKLTAGELEVRLADLPALGKHAELILGEATDRVSFGELQEALGVAMALGVQAIREGWQVYEFVERVRERLGAIGQAEAA